MKTTAKQLNEIYEKYVRHTLNNELGWKIIDVDKVKEEVKHDVEFNSLKELVDEINNFNDSLCELECIGAVEHIYDEMCKCFVDRRYEQSSYLLKLITE